MTELKFIKKAPLYDEMRRQFKDAFDVALIELADYLQSRSPKGVSPGSESLAGSWDIVPARKERGVISRVFGTVVNKSKDSGFRIRGRGPGKFPPFGKDTGLAKWADAKGIPPFLVARKIALEGTKRYREGASGNILKQNPVTLTYASNSPMYTVFEANFQKEWTRLKILNRIKIKL